MENNLLVEGAVVICVDDSPIQNSDFQLVKGGRYVVEKLASTSHIKLKDVSPNYFMKNRFIVDVFNQRAVPEPCATVDQLEKFRGISNINNFVVGSNMYFCQANQVWTIEEKFLNDENRITLAYVQGAWNTYIHMTTEGGLKCDFV